MPSRDLFLDPRRRNYTEHELRRMAAELRRLDPLSPVHRYFRRKGERPVTEYRCHYFGPFPPPYWWRRTGINTLIERITRKRLYEVRRREI